MRLVTNDSGFTQPVREVVRRAIALAERGQPWRACAVLRDVIASMDASEADQDQASLLAEQIASAALRASPSRQA